MAESKTADKTDGAPLNKYEALTLLYLSKQSISGNSPEEVVAKYVETYDRIVREFSRQVDQRPDCQEGIGDTFFNSIRRRL